MKNTKCEAIRLMGHDIHIYDDKIQIFNRRDLTSEDFRTKCDKIVTYLMDEAFIEKKKIRVEMISPKL
jgi:hypothetical protein